MLSQKYLYNKMADIEMQNLGQKSVVEEGSAGEEGTAAGEHGKIMSAFGIFTIVVIIVLIAVTALFATNAYFYNRIRDGSCSKISQSEAEALYWTNVVLAVIAGIMALAAIIMLFVYWKSPNFTKKWVGTVQGPGGYSEASLAARQSAAIGLRSGAGRLAGYGEGLAGYVGPTPAVVPV